MMRCLNGASNRGFTFTEIMVIIAILAALAALAIPNFAKHRGMGQARACAQNMRQIKKVVDMWALATGARIGQAPDMAVLVPAYIAYWPKCGNTAYAIPACGADPQCPVSGSGHKFE